MRTKAKHLLNKTFYFKVTDSTAYKDYQGYICTIIVNKNYPYQYELHKLPISDRCYGIQLSTELDILTKEEYPEYFI
jgi:hypothetical protein